MDHIHLITFVTIFLHFFFHFHLIYVTILLHFHEKRKRKYCIMLRKFKKRLVTAGILISILLTTFPAHADQQEEDAAEIYDLRMQYTQDLIQQDAYNTRLDVYEELEQNTALRQQIVDFALAFVGVTPYVPAGCSLWEGTDCSGFVCLVFGTFGIWLSLSSVDYQYSIGYHVAPEERLPGDIIVYDNGAHVGIYYGNDFVIHCSSPENGTIYSPWNYRNVTAVVRVL